MPSDAKERAERLFKGREEGARALSDYQAKEEAIRQLTAKLRAERLAREQLVMQSATSTQTRQEKGKKR